MNMFVELNVSRDMKVKPNDLKYGKGCSIYKRFQPMIGRNCGWFDFGEFDLVVFKTNTTRY